MDDIYENLENYNDVIELRELRTENKDLKEKLEEYSLAMAKLQKDFDKVSSAFKNLTLNYTSMLQTAREEIERKTKIINNLNVEKDTMIIKYMRSNQNVNITVKTTELNRSNHNQTYIEKEIPKKREEKPNSSKTCDKMVKSPEEKKPSENRNLNIKEDVGVNKLLHSIKKTVPIRDEEKLISKISVQGNENDERRKPLIGENVDFSSGEEFDVHDTKNIKSSYSCRESSNKLVTESNEGKRYKKTSETSSIEDRRSNYYESLKESHRGKSRKWDNEWYIKDESYNSKQRRFSPDKRSRKDHPHQKSNTIRTRILKSPPYEKYDKRHSVKHRNTRNYERWQPYDFDKHKHHDDRPAKHKLPVDYEEPVKKRSKSASKRKYVEDDKVIHDRQMEDNPFSETLKQFESQHASCQSPDYVHMEAVASHPLKEIKETATIKLEDPRVTNKRYVFKIGDNDKEILSTVVGRNIDIKPIKRANWCIPNVQTLQPLTENPITQIDYTINDIYGDIDFTEENTSLESGEIVEPTTYHNTKIDSKKLVVDSIIEKNKEIIVQEIDRKQLESSTILQESLSKYKIPKIKHGDSNTCGENNNYGGSFKDVPCILNDNTKALKVNEINKETKLQTKPSEQIIGRPDSSQSLLLTKQKTIIDNKYVPKNKRTISNNLENQLEERIINRNIVEGDLELSDEASENTDLQQLYQLKNEQCADNNLRNTKVNCKDIGSNKKENVQNNKKENVQSYKEENAQSDKKVNVQSNKEENAQNNKKENVHSNKIENVESNKKENVESNMKENVESNMKESVQSNKEEDVQRNKKENVQSNKEEKVESYKKENVESNKEENVQSNKKENVQSNKEENVQSNKEENVQSNKEEIVQYNKKENVHSNKKENVQSNKKENVESNKKENVQSNKEENVKSNKEENVQSNKDENVQSNKKENVQSNKKENIKSLKEDNLKNTDFECSVSTQNKVDVDAEKLKCMKSESNTKHQKRKKTQKSKDTDTKESRSKSTDHKKKTKTKKLKEMKPKYSSQFKELFGTETTSLITPEDLGLEEINIASDKYVPIFEDAQDAADIEKIAKSGLIGLKHNVDPKNVKIDCNNQTSDIINTNETNVENINVIHVSPVPVINHMPIISSACTTDSKSIDNIPSIAHITPASGIYENMDTKVETESNVIKTVVISTGVQPTFVKDTENAAEPLAHDKILQHSAVTNEIIKNSTVFNALATSTPHKDTSGCSKVNSNINISNNDRLPNVVQQSSDCASISQNETDVPDVRIFVQRRRRTRIKPTS